MDKINKPYEEDEKFDITNAASVGECTGLIKQIPLTDEEFASYHDVYDYGPKQVENEESRMPAVPRRTEEKERVKKGM